MVIPWARIHWISDFKGYGLVANQFIPKGTISFVQDGLDIVVPPHELDQFDPRLIDYIEKYSYEDFSGNRVISWDLGKYMNHDDEANTLTTGYGFEIAIRDIQPGEEITDDYRLFSTHHNTNFSEVTPTSVVTAWPNELILNWNAKVQSALEFLENVDQPLISFIDHETLEQIRQLKFSKENYKCVTEALPLRYKQLTAV